MNLTIFSCLPLYIARSFHLQMIPIVRAARRLDSSGLMHPKKDAALDHGQARQSLRYFSHAAVHRGYRLHLEQGMNHD
ncbi:MULTISPECIES: hypothetical protein [Pseudomonas]|uniref:hypothetical protein n=1 Tax=Pseudomonas TaxID=286 RepID=UPI0013049513|nr:MULTISPECIES: hypothetical protein [Pseudomonas]MBP5117589.1 hypothetical protein [Pseudomonas protegens]QTU19693.1 hypothetical protein HUT22_16675 [Pseudomonas protegens]